MLLKHFLAESLMAFLCLETANRVDQVDLKAVLATVPTRKVDGVLEALLLTLSLMVVLPVVPTLDELDPILNLRPLDLTPVLTLTPPVLTLTPPVLLTPLLTLNLRPALTFGTLALTLTLALAFLGDLFFIF